MPTCPYCDSPLHECPRGTSCPGSFPGHPHPCPECRHGLVCPIHQHLWLAGHYPLVEHTRRQATLTNAIPL